MHKVSSIAANSSRPFAVKNFVFAVATLCKCTINPDHKRSFYEFFIKHSLSNPMDLSSLKWISKNWSNVSWIVVDIKMGNDENNQVFLILPLQCGNVSISELCESLLILLEWSCSCSAKKPSLSEISHHDRNRNCCNWIN